MWWARKKYLELGNPEYIGFCHYRRFLTAYAVDNRPIIDIK
jgi:hypothetical protein